MKKHNLSWHITRFLLSTLGFKKIERQVDDITTIDNEGRDTFIFIEANHQMVISTDLGFDGKDYLFTIHRGAINHWKPPHHKEEVTEEDKDRIIQKLCKYFENNGEKYRIAKERTSLRYRGEE